ncbi:uncharacterized protein Z519_04732 [Cladophialophora bantiana CBS 173.52]|uniref:LYR motif-containing protein Cup1-like N-terminal domain-containing protein n=1 Tax=Cladophialophora bantiana (strain ATCC 10958 / CBS 173.52 / CDC B-1940 / NIH 8579) TaxID=1442370 RepID=A0A0D2HV53_CLAB1|nr:uncharacterized protein Z519_04732 [Cladophialophora bantiana CBS 173.52]KIW94755.1 hypothetical protein Z519_04732 [Cladophialophora bantiana CBS 173.52]
MPPPETNPLHIYRACLRECSYLPLPQCRAYMRKFTIDGFRRWIPPKDCVGRSCSKAHSAGGRHLAPEKVTRLLHQARKLASILRHANQGYIVPLENVLRMAYGRKGPRKYELLAQFLNPALPASEGGARLLRDKMGQNIPTVADAISLPSSDLGGDELLAADVEEEDEIPKVTTEEDTLYPSLFPTITTTQGGTSGPCTEHPTSNTSVPAAPRPPRKPDSPKEEKWKLDLPPRLLALIASQASEQVYFARVGAHLKVKSRFNPPQTTIWGTPLPQSRYKNLRIKWYNHNIKAVLPPLPEDEYRELHDLVSGKKEMKKPLIIPRRRTPAPVSVEDTAQSLLERQSCLILEGPQPGPRLKDWRSGRPHEITPRLLRRLLSRVVLKQTPLVKTATPATKAAAGELGLVFYWDDGISVDEMGKSEQKMSKSLGDRQASLLFG